LTDEQKRAAAKEEVKKMVQEMQADSDIEEELPEMDLEDDEVLEQLLYDVEHCDLNDREEADRLYSGVVEHIDKLSQEHTRVNLKV